MAWVLILSTGAQPGSRLVVSGLLNKIFSFWSSGIQWVVGNEETKKRECWKFLDWRLNSENDSRVHGQPSFAIAVSTQWFMDLSGKNLFSNVKVIWKGRWSIDYHPNPSRLFSFFVFFTFIIFINLFNGMAKETPVEKMKTTVGLVWITLVFSWDFQAVRPHHPQTHKLSTPCQSLTKWVCCGAQDGGEDMSKGSKIPGLLQET